MLIATAMLLAATQMPYSPSDKSEACAQSNVVKITPADTLQLLDDFRASLAAGDRRRLDQALPRDADGGIAQCDAVEGSRASCETSAYMPALRSTGLMPRFLATICPKKAQVATRSVNASPAVAGVTSASSQAVRTDRLQEHGTILKRPIIPSEFRGHWSVDLRECVAPPTDDSQLWITATSLSFYETNGRIVRVAAESERRVVVTVRSEGEGITFKSRKGLALSSDRHTLTVRDEEDTGRTTFNRCTAAKTAPTFIPHHTMSSR